MRAAAGSTWRGSAGRSTRTWSAYGPPHPIWSLANAEENRREDVDALRAAGIPVWVTYPRTLDEALRLAGPADGRTRRRRPAVAGRRARAAGRRRSRAYVVRAVVPVWRRPWVVLGSRHVRRRRARAARGRQRVRGGAGALSAPAARRAANGGRGPGRAAGRAVRVHRRRRAGGVPRPAVRAGVRSAPDVVRPVAGDRPRGPDGGARARRCAPARGTGRRAPPRRTPRSPR